MIEQNEPQADGTAAETTSAATAASSSSEGEASAEAHGGRNDDASAQAAPADAAGLDRDAYIVELQADLLEARKAIEDRDNALMYSKAEFQNFRRRRDEEARDAQKYANMTLVKELLPVVDNFERALAAAETSRNFDALIAGISGTMKQMQAFLAKAGVTPIESLGKEFDPRLHEAIGQAESGEHAPNTVAEELQRGYMMDERVLRPAVVKVARES